MWGKGEEKSQQGREHRSWYFPSLHFSLNISSPLRPLSHQAFLGVMGKKEDHTGKSGGVSSSLSSISSLLWPLSQVFLEGKGEERTEQERQWQVNPLLSPHLHKISSLLLMSSQYRITYFDKKNTRTGLVHYTEWTPVQTTTKSGLSYRRVFIDHFIFKTIWALIQKIFQVS